MTAAEITRLALDAGAMQKRDELEALLNLLADREKKVNRVIEIGTAQGGTLAAWCAFAAPTATIVSVDLPDGDFGGGYSIGDMARMYERKQPGQRLLLLRGNSHDYGIVKQVWDAVYESADLLFIDGDHTLEGVRKDYETYSTLVRPGGVIALHDIRREQEHPACRVADFWETLTTGEHRKIISKDDRAWGGIGVVIKP